MSLNKSRTKFVLWKLINKTVWVFRWLANHFARQALRRRETRSLTGFYSAFAVAGVSQEEIETPWHKHLFLQSKLNEGHWCPRKGAIRNFMTSVITALSMNPHLSLREKHEHIEWFRAYFEEKAPLLSALGLLQQSESKQAISST